MNRKPFLVFFFISAVLHCLAQPAAKMPAPDAAKRIDAWTDSAKTWLPIDPQKSLYYTTKLLELSISSGNTYGELSSYRLLGNISYAYGKYDLAIKYSNKVAERLRGAYKSRDFYDVFKLLGLATKALNQVSTSRGYFNEYLESARQYNDSASIVDARNNIAALYLKEKRYDDAIRISQSNSSQPLTYSNDDDATKNSNLRVSNNAASTNLILGKAYYMKGDRDKAYSQLFNSMGKDDVSIISPSGTAALPEGVAELFFKSDSLLDKVSSQSSFATTDNNAYLNLNTMLLNSAAYDVGSQYLSTNNTVSAIPYLEQSATLSETHGSLAERIRSERALSEAYEKSGETAKAAAHYKKYAQLLEEQQGRSTEAQGQASALNNALENINQRVQLLEQEKEISQRTIGILKREQQLKNIEVNNRNRVITGMIVLLLVLAAIGYFMVRTVQQKRRANLLLELRSLRTQMNPHFIFNALNSVNSFISLNDERRANRFLASFSTLTRSILNHAEAEFISLEEELALLQRYLELEHDRFGDKFDYTFTVDPELDPGQINIPPMLVQPFVENAIWHGLRYLDDRGHLEVLFSKAGEELVITINDNGIGRRRSQEEKTKHQKAYRSTGMQNIDKRIAIINKVYHHDIRISVNDRVAAAENPDTGTSVEIRFSINTRIHAESAAR